MNNTLKTILAAVAIGSATFANAVSIPSTGTVDMSNTGYDGNLTGGEFKAEIAGFDDMYTFCLEKSAHIDLPGTYTYELSDRTNPGGDVISVGTAYLYKKFATGTLYDRTLDAAHDLNSGMLQLAIWVLEDEYGNPDLLGTNTFYNEVVSLFGGVIGAKADYTGTEVRVMQLSDGASTNVQDQLVYVPDSGTTLVLLGFGLAGLALVRRRV